MIIADRPDAEHIIRILEDRGCDLIVMGTHGRIGTEAPAVRQRDRGSGTEGPLSCDGRQAPAHGAGAPTHRKTADQPASRVKS